MDLANRRETYEEAGLDVDDVHADPIVQFEQWYRDAEAAQLWEANAMVVSAVDADGWPTSRYVLMKAFDHHGFVFFTNLESDKAVALDGNPQTALTFGWLPLRRQIRVLGLTERVSSDEADDYWARRPRGSQIGGWASPQSQVVPDRAELDRRYAAFEAGVGDGLVERPEHWGGYRVVPQRIEFWQGRPNRFHDRLVYTLSPTGSWPITRLAP